MYKNIFYVFVELD